MILTDQKRSTVLAALRYFQKNYQDGLAFGMSHNFFDEEEPLTEKEIDDLCEDINCDE